MAKFVFLRQLNVMLWKNYLLKKANVLSLLAELFLPVLFMSLLILIKSITDVYDSPTIAYYCGQAYPWFYSAGFSADFPTPPAPFQCIVKPNSCNAQNYYQDEISFPYSYNGNNNLFTGWSQLGYVTNAFTDGIATNPWYTATIADKSSIYNDLQTSNPSVPFHVLANRLAKYNTKLAIVAAEGDPSLLNEARNLQAYFTNKFQVNGTFTKLFNSNSALENYVTDENYNEIGYSEGKIAFAVVLNSVNVASAQWDYSIRVNYTTPEFSRFPTVACLSGTTSTDSNFECDFKYTIPSTKFYTNFFKPTSIEYMNGYLYSGFSTIQEAVDEYILSQYGTTVDVQASVGLMPSQPFLSDNFQYVISSTLGLFYILSYLYPVSRIVRSLVVDKETRIREGMKMMGLTDAVYDLSWYITILFQLTLVAILITMVTSGSVFEYSNNILVFIFFEAFSIAIVSFCFFLATFFSRSKVASLIAPIVFFASFFPYFAVNDAQFSTSTKAATCLLAPSCFALGADVFANYEGGLIGVQPSNSSDLTSNFSYSICISMLIVDAFLYGILAWYLDKVLPSEYGTPLPFYFVFQPSYWGFNSTSTKTVDDEMQYNVLASDNNANSESTNNKYFESVSPELRQQETDEKCVSIQGLRKVYKTPDTDRIAVNGLFCNFYEGQVSVLLGHNGAGKTTTIGMLTGLVPPSSGEAMIRGKRLSSDLQQIRQDLGVCPQHDVLFPELTVLQHLQIFAAFKGVDPAKVMEESNIMIAEVGLLEKAFSTASGLSGGQKRKLSLGIALIGDSKVVILDEPTSGMDPYSRRSTWNVIQKHKRGRCIMLSTHFMDEADILGDRIIIMAEGKLQTTGSPLYLKGVFGVGYTLNVVKESQNQDSSLVLDIVRRYIPDVQVLSDVGTEQSFRLPFSSSSQFKMMFDEFDALKNKDIKEYRISVTTLEEVFLRVGKGLQLEDIDRVDSNSVITKPMKQISPSTQSVVLPAVLKQEQEDRVKYQSTFYFHFIALLYKRFVYGKRDRGIVICQIILPVLLVILGLGLLLVTANVSQPDLVLSPENFNPTYSSSYKNFVPFTVSYDSDFNSPTSDEVLTRFNGNQENGVFGVGVSINAALIKSDPFGGCSQGAGPLFNTSAFLISNSNPSDEKGSTRFGAVTMSTLSNDSTLVYNILVNGSANHGVGIFVNLVHTAYLQVKSTISNAKITTHNYPLPITYDEQNEQNSGSAFLAALFLSIAFCFIPSSYATYVVKEREVKSKFQQIISGVNLVSYWSANLVWDVLSYLPTALFVFAMLYAYNITAFIDGSGPQACILVLLLFGPAIASFTYILSFPFKSHSTAQIAHMFLNFVVGLCLMITHFVLALIIKTRSIAAKLRYFFRLFPAFCLGDSFLILALCTNGDSCPAATENGYDFTARAKPLDWDVAGANVTFLAIEAVVYFLITLLIEYLLTFPTLLSWLFYVQDPGLSVNFKDEEDKDVSDERLRVENGYANGDVVKLDSLRKIYSPIGVSSKKPKVAVQSLSFGIPRGECFGFLGINGAGKTTTLSILCGEFPPTSGSAFIDGCDIRHDQTQIRRKIGFCPQFDALLDLLTVREHLELFAAIKGVSPFVLANGRKRGLNRQQVINEIVESKMQQLDLLDFENKTAQSLSGGNKRKLSVAIALIGDPSIVYLDGKISNLFSRLSLILSFSSYRTLYGDGSRCS